MLKKILNIGRFKTSALSIKLLIRLGVSLCLLFGIALGVMWYMAGSRNTPEYALEQINTAIQLGRGEQLSRYVDFRILGQRFVDSILKYQGRSLNENEHRDFQETVQRSILEAFQASRNAGVEGGASAGGGGHGAETPPPASAPVSAHKTSSRVLPADILSQLIGKPFTLQWSDTNLAIAAAPFHHDVLQYDGILKLSMRKGDENWMMYEVANADELIQTYFAALKQDKDRKTNEFIAENQRRTELMNSHCYVSSCRAFVAKNVDARADVPLVISIEGLNMGAQALLSAGMICTLTDPSGNVLGEVPLNSVRKVDAGKPFQQNWQFELSRALPQTQLLLREKTLACRTRVAAVTTGDGKIVFIRPQKELEELLK